MSEEKSGEKTEQPTRKKILDSRKSGQVAVSKELTLAFVSIIVVALIFFMKVRILSLYNHVFQFSLQRITTNDLPLYKISAIYYYALQEVYSIIFLIIAATIAFTIAFVSFQLGGIVLATKKFMKFDINNMNPVNNAKNIFSLKNLVKFLKNIIHIVLQVGVSFWVVQQHYSDGFNIFHYSIYNIVYWMLLFLGHLLLIIFLSAIIFGFLDLLWEKRTLNKKLMMSIQELKKEYKETEGNPEIKGHRQQLHREILEGGDEGFANHASMVLANPTHYAIVIMYKPKKYLKPIILYTAKNYKAQLIFQKAKKYNIPIIHDKWLARNLYNLTEPGDTIPPSLSAAFLDTVKSNLHLFPELLNEMQTAIEDNLNKLQKMANIINPKSAASI